jgi:hypothetical protein
MGKQQKYDDQLRQKRIARTHQLSNYFIHVSEVYRVQEAGPANVSHDRAKSDFHQNFTDQQGRDGNEHAGVDTIITNQGNQAFAVQECGEDEQRKPSDGNYKTNTAAEVPLIRADESQRSLEAIEWAATD